MANEPTVEEMARELAVDDLACPTGCTMFSACRIYNKPTDNNEWNGCERCWMENATPSEIRARYQQMKGERG